MIIAHINIAVFAKIFKPKINTVVNEDISKDFSLVSRIEEVIGLRTKDSKTYLKKNGMYETEIYSEQIHYFKNGEFQEIDNTLRLENSQYTNSDNTYKLSLPKSLNSNEKFSLSYLNNEIKIYYDLHTSVEGQLSNKIARTKANLKDEIIYTLSNQEKLQYILLQDSIKENIILDNYIENYQYSYYIDTALRVERVGNEIYFFDQQQLVFVMNEYYMYDASDQDSNDIEVVITTIDADTYQITVTPSNDFLSQAVYPVIIDPEIKLIDNGVIDGIIGLYSIDKQAGLNQFLTLGSFTLANRDNSTFADDEIAQLHVYIPREYTNSIGDIITRNQLMYANITLNTLDAKVNGDTKVTMKYGDCTIDSVEFHSSNVFDHQFNIYEAISDKLDEFKTNDIDMSFELLVEGGSHTEVTYSLGGGIGGKNPVITLGYLDEAGLADYYTYESMPLNAQSNVYIAHNSGNLTYIYNDYMDNQLLNLSHIYNANRKYNNSIYGNGFNLSYNEELTSSYSTITLTEGNGRRVLFYPTNTDKTEYLATDGSGDTLTKQLSSSNTIIGYEIQTSDGGVKIYTILEN